MKAVNYCLEPMENMLELYKRMVCNSMTLSYKGAVSFELIDSILQIISIRLEYIEQDITIKKRVYSIMIECLQNLCNYIEKVDKTSNYDPSCAWLSIENQPHGYTINTGNFIQKEKINKLKCFIDKINNCSDDERKRLYNKVLMNEEFNSKDGDGLGLLDIARKTKGKLNYNFQTVDEDCSFFNLEVNIER